MSDPMAKASRSRAKDIRQGVAAQKPGTRSPLAHKHRKAKPWRVIIVTMGWPIGCQRKPWCAGHYATQADAEKAADAMRHRYLTPTTLRPGVVIPPRYKSITVEGPTDPCF